MDRWNEIAESNESSVYHLGQWGELLNMVHGHKLVYLEEEKGIFPLAFVKSLIFGNRLISLPFADYGGPCAADEETIGKLILRAEAAAEKLKVDFLEVRTPAEESFGSLENRGFARREDYCTFIVDLRVGKEILWQGIGVKNRNMVRLAERDGLKISFCSKPSDLEIFYELYLKTMKRIGSPPHPYSFFQAIWKLFYPQRVLIPLISAGERPVASGMFFLHQKTIHHAYSCSLPGKPLTGGANNFLLWRIMEWALESGFYSLDLGRTRPEAGNFLFKKRWGGKLVSMPYFYKFYKRQLAQRQEIQYQKLSEFWANYLPKFIADRIGPWLIKQI